MPAQITLKAAGLQVSPNQLDTKEGALATADDIIISRDNVIESRRGYKFYGTQTTSPVQQLAVYKSRLIRHVETTLQFDTLVLNADDESTFNSFAGSYEEVDPGLRIKSIESNGNFYFTTAEGIKKISATSGTDFSTAAGYITNAGGVKAINGSARINFTLGDTSGWLPADSAVAYRVVWAIKDANNNIIQGAPSERIVVYNPFLNLLIPDYMRLLGALDNITTVTNTAFIGDGDYVSTLSLPYTATASDLQAAIITLATKIDNDILYAAVGAASTPLDMTGVTPVVANGSTATITFVSGDPTQYFDIGSKIFLQGFTGAAAVLNGGQTVSNVTSSTLSISTTETFIASATGATAEITSFEYRNGLNNVMYNGAAVDLTTLTVNNPATHDQLATLQAAILGIMTSLQAEPSTVITPANQTSFIDVLDVTSSATVILTIAIPEGVTVNHFLQIYRSDIAQATGPTILSDLTPNDEQKQVYEAFPTDAELIAGTMTVEDIVVDAFRGANLYTNPSTGEGIDQANDIPPVAKDINRFKNVLFYANTKTKHRKNINLLGVQNFKAGGVTTVSSSNPAVITTSEDHELTTGELIYLNGTGVAALDTKIFKVTVTGTNTFTIPVSGVPGSSTGYWTNSMIAFVTESGAEQYYFIKGLPEITNISTVADVAGSLAGKYFTLNSANDEVLYYAWYSVSGTGTDPALTGKFGIEISVATGDSANAVAQKTRDTLAQQVQNFTITGATNNIIITNTSDGITTDATVATSGFTVIISQQGAGENVAAHEVLLSSSVSPAQAVDSTARSLQKVVNATSGGTIYIYYLSGLSDVPGKLGIEGRSISSPQFAVLANNFDTGDSFDPPITPSPTASLTNTASSPTIVSATSHGLVSGNKVVIAFSNSTPSINGIQLVTFLSTSTYSVPVNVSTAGTSGSMIKFTNAVVSENEQKQNRIYYSKYQQPEAVPILNYFDVGSEEKQILRIFPLRDSLFVFKEDGLFRISGESAPFNLALFDSSCILIAADSLGLSNNLIYGWTTQGIHTVSESGIDIVSRDIDTLILQLASSNYPNFKTITWGVGYDSDNSYTVYTNKTTSDEVATIAFRFSNLTNTWTIFNKTTTCGIINQTDDKMYMGAGDVNFMEQERKSFTREDYADREIRTTLTPNTWFDNGTRIKLPNVTDMKIGDVLYQEQTITTYKYNILLTKLDIDPGVAQTNIVSITTGLTPTITLANQSFLNTDVNTGTNTITLNNHGYTNGQKVRFVSTGTLPAPLVIDTDYYVTSVSVNTFQLSTILNGTVIDLTTTGTGTHIIYRFHNLLAGEFVTLKNTDSDPVIDGTYAVTTIVNGYTFTLTLLQAITTPGTSGIARYAYEANLTMSGGADVRLKLLALADKLDTDPGTERANYQEIIDTQNGTITSNSAANPSVISMKTNAFLPSNVNTGTDLITIATHGYTNGQRVTFSTTGTLPAGLLATAEYYIVNATTNTFQLSLSPTLTPVVNITTIGSGLHTIRLSHGLQTGRVVSIIGTNSVPVIDGINQITVLNAFQFSVPISVIISGSSGTFSTQPTSFIDINACYNALINNLNLDPGVIFNNYTLVSETTPIESLITGVNKFTNELTLSPGLQFVQGRLTVFRAIQTQFSYAPQTMGDPFGYKHMTTFTMMFDNKAFTGATVSFGSDLLPEYIDVPFTGDGNGIFGLTTGFGDGFFGGGSHGAPFRTYFPRQVMRCRYMLIKFTHRTAREKYSVNGITLDGNITLSNRAYRR